MQTDAALGEILLRAFILRRVYLIGNSVGDAGADRIQSFRRHAATESLPLAETAIRHTYLDVEHDPDVQTMLDHFGIQPDSSSRADLPWRNWFSGIQAIYRPAECFA